MQFPKLAGNTMNHAYSGVPPLGNDICSTIYTTKITLRQSLGVVAAPLYTLLPLILRECTVLPVELDIFAAVARLTCPPLFAAHVGVDRARASKDRQDLLQLRHRR